MKRIIFLFIALMLCGCGKTQYKSVQDTLAELKNYSANADVTYFSNKGETTYNMDITAQNDGKYKMTVNSPKEYKGCSVLYDGNMIWQYNPNLPNNKISILPTDKASRREILVFSFMKNYVQTDRADVTASTLDESKCTVLEADIKDGGNLFKTEKLWVNNESKLPERLAIYSADNKQIVVENFTKCEYNTQIDKDFFVPKN